MERSGSGFVLDRLPEPGRRPPSLRFRRGLSGSVPFPLSHSGFLLEGWLTVSLTRCCWSLASSASRAWTLSLSATASAANWPASVLALGVRFDERTCLRKGRRCAEG